MPRMVLHSVEIIYFFDTCGRMAIAESIIHGFTLISRLIHTKTVKVAAGSLYPSIHQEFVWSVKPIPKLYAWLTVFRTRGFTHKPQVVPSARYSESARFELFSHQRSSVVHSLHHGQDLNPSFPVGRPMFCSCSIGSSPVQAT